MGPGPTVVFLMKYFVFKFRFRFFFLIFWLYFSFITSLRGKKNSAAVVSNLMLLHKNCKYLIGFTPVFQLPTSNNKYHSVYEIVNRIDRQLLK